MLRGDKSHLQLALHFLVRHEAEERSVQPDVGYGHDGHAPEQRSRQRTLRIAHFTGHIRRRVPARIGVGDIDQTDGKCRAEQLSPPRAVRHGQERLLVATGCDATHNESDNQRQLEQRKNVLEPTAPTHTPHVDGGDDKECTDSDHLRRDALREKRFGVVPQRHAGQRHRRGKANRQRDKAGEESYGGMIDDRQVVVFAPRTRHGGAELAVDERTAEGNQSAHDPERKQCERRVQVEQLEAERGKDAGADHVGHREGGHAREAQSGVLGRFGGRGSGMRLVLVHRFLLME